MKKIIITEQQFKRLVEELVSEEEHNIFNDPKAIVLVDWLNDFSGEEYGLMTIISHDHGKNYDLYGFNDPDVFDSEDIEYYVLTSREFNIWKKEWEPMNIYDKLNVNRYGHYYILN
ncbi:hypothetical protein COB55_05635 [Candidatus Wolfebacteria bacterium]|nr:MAG: hypothetical protein COB55_05635 [Candidatus Wolfebacteria bacterium]